MPAQIVRPHAIGAPRRTILLTGASGVVGSALLRAEYAGKGASLLDAIAVPGFEPGRTQLAAVSRAGAASAVYPQLALCWGSGDALAAFCADGAG